jgi:hypothetical protein
MGGFIMQAHNHRVLVENGITPAEWAVLSAISYLLPIQPNQLLIQSRLEAEDEFSIDELKNAAHNCLRHAWIIQNDTGIALTEEGRQLKERLSQELIETVELLPEKC